MKTKQNNTIPCNTTTQTATKTKQNKNNNTSLTLRSIAARHFV